MVTWNMCAKVQRLAPKNGVTSGQTCAGSIEMAEPLSNYLIQAASRFLWWLVSL